MKIAIVVPGRFHAFDLSLALLRQGHQVSVFTNYPAWAVGRFGVPPQRVRSLWIHGVTQRILERIPGASRLSWTEAAMHRWFGRWAARELMKEQWDVVHCWSGVSEELLLALRGADAETWLMRGSAHIRVQAQLLAEEERRVGARVDKPSPWMVAREEREYRLATTIRLASTFAYQSFVSQGEDEARLRLLRLGADTRAFKSSAQEVAERRQRILDQRPLRILYVGSVTFQKGAQDLAAVIDALAGPRFEFRVVGSAHRECAQLVRRMRRGAHIVDKVPQAQLIHEYSWADVFMFPTIQDGFAVVLAQAQACGLPILATTNCAAPDMVEEGRTGWVLPIRSPLAFIDRLKWCDTHRDALAKMIDHCSHIHRARDWDDVALDFNRLVAAGRRAG
jgi:glycosyltransferase involved in cell wall biosynthesis